MNRTLTLLSTLVLLGACASGPKALVLKGDARLVGGGETVAKLELPGEWTITGKKADRLDASGSDNFSKLTMTLAPVLLAPEACAELATRAATDLALSAAGGNKEIKAEIASVGSPEVVGFTETVPATPPGPADRFVQGRVVCKAGALVGVQCSTGIARKDTTGADCKKALEALTVEAPVARP